MDNTSFISVAVSKNESENRTSPLYVQEKGKLALNDILSEKPADFNGQIDISWLSDALNKKAGEIKYAPWDALYMPKGLWVSSAYGNGTIIATATNGKICISSDYGANWEEKQLADNLKAIAYGNGVFIICSNNGKYFKSSDNGISWEENFIDDDNFSCISYNNNKFVVGSISGRIYISENNGGNWQNICEYSNMQITKIIYTNTNIMLAIGISENPISIYSLDNGLTWGKIAMPPSVWTSVIYANDRFTACAYDGEIRLIYCLEKDLLAHNPIWQSISISYKEPWSDIAYGANTYTLVSSSGVTLASYDGIRWIKTPCPSGSWNNILRTDYFFMAFSISGEESSLNAIRSSNGGLSGIMFATLNEIIQNEDVDKAVNPQTLKDYLAYRTGKNISQYPVYSDDLLIECTATDTKQIKITNINGASPVTDYNDITAGGIYIIEKQLTNAPNSETGFLLVQKDGNKIYQFFSKDYLFVTGYIRKYDNIWESWQKKLIKQENIENIDLSNNKISISEYTEYSSIQALLAEQNGSIKKFAKTELDEHIKNSVSNTLNLMAGNSVYWQHITNYNIGAMVLGSDNALYYCIKANGILNNQNPVSSPTYWLKLIDTDGKINADNLNKALGKLALLNNIDLDSSFITGMLPVTKGGTDSPDGFGWKNIYLDSDFNKKIGLNYPFTTHKILDFPGSSSSHRTIINFTDNNQFYLETVDSFNLTTYICSVNRGIVDSWKLCRNGDGSIPIGIGGTGLTHGALGKATIVETLAPTQTNKYNYKSGDVIYRYSFGNNAISQSVPAGGCWLINTFVFTKGTGQCRIDLGGAYILAGNSTLDTNSSFDFIHILTKIA